MNTILIDVHIVDGEVPLLFGKDTGELWEAKLNMKKETLDLKFAENEENTFPCPTIGSHYKIKLHDFQEWNLPETVRLVKTIYLTQEEKKEKLVSFETIKKIHERLTTRMRRISCGHSNALTSWIPNLGRKFIASSPTAKCPQDSRRHFPGPN